MKDIAVKISNKKTTLLLASLMVGTSFLGGCQTLHTKKKEPVYVERSVESLYNEAMTKFQKKQYVEATKAFEEVERQHPYSEWARRSILMGAYSQYKQNKYDEAIAAAQRFISLYQSNQDNAAYAYYLIAMCYFERISDVDHDQKITQLALASLNDVVQRYPDTVYAKDAKIKMDMATDQLAGKEMEVGRYYLFHNQPIAAIGRFRAVVDNFKTTSQVPEALARLTEAYFKIGLVDEATKNAAVLGYNYPGSKWYKSSYQLVTSKGAKLETAPRKDNTLDKFIPSFHKMKKTKGKAISPPQ